MNERDPSIALNNDGHFLNIFYVLDRDAGFYELNEGIRTLNPAVLHRVLKYDLANHLNSQREWLPNYPLHRDSSGFWQDPYGWVWFENGPWFDVEEPDFGVVQEPSSLPVDFVVGHASPNPFNAVTSIPFSLSARSEIVFRVFNLLGQEILQQRRMYDAGNHRFHFDTSSLVSPLSSGVYLVQIGHGNESILRKVVLLK